LTCGNGNSEYLSTILSYIEGADLKKKIIFHGWCHGKRKNSFVDSLDALIVPSLYEPFGYVILEAMVHRIPLICSDRGGIKEIVGNYRYRFDPYESDGLTNCIKKFQSDPIELIDEETSRLFERTTLFSVKNMVQEYENVFVKLHNKLGHYSELNDKMITDLIDKSEPYNGYWQESERYILELMRKHIRENIKNDDNWLLDAGCGVGRLLPEFVSEFSHVMAIDPDENRLMQAKEFTEKQNISESIVLEVSSIEDLCFQGQFDAILCSHVLQHIDTALVPIIIEKMRSLLKKQGIILITTCNSSTGYDHFIKNVSNRLGYTEEIISEDEFNSLIVNTRTNLGPVHFFSRNNLEAILEKNGFEIMTFRTFHILEECLESGGLGKRDILINASPHLQSNYGRDCFIAAKLKEID
jgi:2-polyprenyl-3-methyl-5-hydroxy-6-metoxy-1,4-benzoquinol methylase